MKKIRDVIKQRPLKLLLITHTTIIISFILDVILNPVLHYRIIVGSGLAAICLSFMFILFMLEDENINLKKTIAIYRERTNQSIRTNQSASMIIRPSIGSVPPSPPTTGYSIHPHQKHRPMMPGMKRK